MLSKLLRIVSLNSSLGCQKCPSTAYRIRVFEVALLAILMNLISIGVGTRGRGPGPSRALSLMH